MTDSLEVIIAKAALEEIIEGQNAGEFEYSDFIADYEFAERMEFQQAKPYDEFPEEWLLKDDRLHVRVIVPQKPGSIMRHDRSSLAWVTWVDIDVRKKLGNDAKQGDGSISRDELSKLGRFVEQLFLRTGYQLDEARFDVSGVGEYAEWIDGGREDVKPQSEIMFKYMSAALRKRQFYGSIRQVFQIT